MALTPQRRHRLDAESLVPAQRSWLIAIDTATDQAGIALFDGEHLAELSWPGGRQQTTTVLPALEGLLRQQGLAMEDVGAIAVATGPGSFTGLRVGLSLAKGLALTGDRSLVGVNTLDIAAAPHQEAGVACVALVPAGRGRIVWSSYKTGETPSGPINSSFDEFLVLLCNQQAAIVVGEMTPDQRQRVVEAHHRTPALVSTRRPGVLAQLGLSRWRSGAVDDPTGLEPLYVHGLPNPRKGAPVPAVSGDVLDRQG